MSPLLADRGAVVVGGSRGIGAAVAALLAQHGAGVVVNGRDAEATKATADGITAAGGRAVPILVHRPISRPQNRWWTGVLTSSVASTSW